MVSEQIYLYEISNGRPRAQVKKGGRLCISCYGQDALWPVRSAQEDTKALNEKVAQNGSNSITKSPRDLMEA